MTQTPDAKKLITQTEAARYLGVHRRTLRRWIDRGVGPPRYRVATGLKFSRADLDTWLRQNYQDGTSRPVRRRRRTA